MAYRTRIRSNVEFFVYHCPRTNQVQEIFAKQKDALRLSRDSSYIGYCPYCNGFHSHPYPLEYYELDSTLAEA